MKVNLLRDILALLSGDLARNLFTVLRIRVVTFATTITMIAMMMMMMMMMMMAMMILIILMVTPASPSGEGRQCTPRALVEHKPEIILILLIFFFFYIYMSHLLFLLPCHLPWDFIANLKHLNQLQFLSLLIILLTSFSTCFGTCRSTWRHCSRGTFVQTSFGTWM